MKKTCNLLTGFCDNCRHYFKKCYNIVPFFDTIFNMGKIKLIAFDIDGTVANSKKEISPAFFDFVKNHREYQFVAASGRQYFSLAKTFKDIKDCLIFLSDNGSLITRNDEVIYTNQIKRENVLKIIETVDKLEGVSVYVGCVHGSYMRGSDIQYEKEFLVYNDVMGKVDDLKEVVEKDEVIKIALFYPNKDALEKIKSFPELPEGICAIVSGDEWIDISEKENSKGHALNVIQKLLNVSYDETMCFGDYMNDYEMFLESKYGIAMGNACDELKKVAFFVTDSCDNDGVMKVLNNIDKVVSKGDKLMENHRIDDQLNNKKELVEKAKSLTEKLDTDPIVAVKEAENLSRRWREHDEESFLEKELREEFEGYLNVVYAKRNEVLGNIADAKKELIAKAKEALNSTNMKKASEAMDELMESWKACGHLADREADDALWAEFRAVRDEFFEKRKAFYQELREKSKNAKAQKEEIVAKAQALAESTEWKKTADEFNKLLEEWKKTARAGKEVDDALWAEFSKARKAFFDAREKYYKQLDAEFKKRAEAKEALVEQAKALVEGNEFSKEVTEKIKGLREQWKAIGSAGKQREDAIWEQFNGFINQYFDGLKSVNESRHEEWVERMEDNIAYKKQQIERLKRDIIREENNAKESLRESAIEEAEALIAEKNAMIDKLTKDIEDIEAKIAK